MPVVSEPRLTISESNGQMTVLVHYEVTITPFERTLFEMGLNYHSHITLHGMDGDTVGPSLDITFPHSDLPIAESSDNTFGMDERGIAPRFALQEDPTGNPDELKAKIRIHTMIPPVFTDDVFTEQRVLTSS